MEIEPHLHPLMSGLKRSLIRDLIQQHQVQVYFPLAFTCLSGPSSYQKTIYITGLPDPIQAVKQQLLEWAERLTPLTKSVQCVPKKLDWLQLHAKEELRKIMLDNGVYFDVPAIASNKNLVVFYGTEAAYLERALRAFMRLVT